MNYRLLTPDDIDEFIKEKQKSYSDLYDKVHNRSGEHGKSAWFMCGGDEKGGNGKPPDYELYYFYINVRETDGLHDVLSLGISPEALNLASKPKHRNRLSPAVSILKEMQKDDKKFEAAVSAMAISFKEGNLNTLRISLTNELESLQQSQKSFEEDKLKYFIQAQQEQRKEDGDEVLIEVYKKMMRKASRRAKRKKAEIVSLREQLKKINEEINSQIKIKDIGRENNEAIDNNSSSSNEDGSSDGSDDDSIFKVKRKTIEIDCDSSESIMEVHMEPTKKRNKHD